MSTVNTILRIKATKSHRHKLIMLDIDDAVILAQSHERLLAVCKRASFKLGEYGSEGYASDAAIELLEQAIKEAESE